MILSDGLPLLHTRAAAPLWGHEGEPDMSSEDRVPGLWKETGKEGDLDSVPRSASD